MGNKPGSNKPEAGATVDIGKALPQVKMMLAKLENIYPGHNLHFLFLDSEFDPLIANSSWGDLEVGQRVVNSIFAKLRLTAKQFAQTLNESETRCIHMKGDSNIFSYYAIKDFHLVIHRTFPAPPPPNITTTSSPSPSNTTTLPTKSSPSVTPKHSNPPTGMHLNLSNTVSRDKSPAPRGHTPQPSTTFVKSGASPSSSEPPSPRSAAPKSPRDNRTGSSSSSSSVLYRDEEDKSEQVEALLIVVQELIYGHSKRPTES